MIIPMTCLWLSRNVLGLDDPFSDNISGVVIGQQLGQFARFYLFRVFVFQAPPVHRPVHADHLPAFMHWLDAPDGVTEEEDATGSSTSGRVPPAAP
jgi:hypothetical protein